MTDNKPAYTVRIAEVDGTTRYFTAFVDGSGIQHEIEIPREVYLALEDCRLTEKRQENEFDRHRERFELSEAQLAVRTLRPPLPMEEAVTQTVDMQAALATLTDTQRRRFLLYHDHGLSFEQIAKAENRIKSTIVESIMAASEKIKNYFDSDPYKRGAE